MRDRSKTDMIFTHIQPCHIQSPGIFRAGGIFETLWNFDQAYSEYCHSQNSLFIYWAIFRHIQNVVQQLHMQKHGIFGILKHSEPFHNCISTHIQTPIIFMKMSKCCVTLKIQNSGILAILLNDLKLDTYAEPSQRFKGTLMQIWKSANVFVLLWK